MAEKEKKKTREELEEDIRKAIKRVTYQKNEYTCKATRSKYSHILTELSALLL